MQHPQPDWLAVKFRLPDPEKIEPAGRFWARYGPAMSK